MMRLFVALAIPDSVAADTAVDALVHALVPPKFLGGRS